MRLKLSKLTNKLAYIARLHQFQLQEYRNLEGDFERLFPPHPGSHCRYCLFNYRCHYG